MALPTAVHHTNRALVAHDKFQQTVLVEVESRNAVGVGVLVNGYTPQVSERTRRGVVPVGAELLRHARHTALYQHLQLPVIVDVCNKGDALAREIGAYHKGLTQRIVVHIPHISIHRSSEGVGATVADEYIQIAVAVEVGHLGMTILRHSHWRNDRGCQRGTITSRTVCIGEIHSVGLVTQY